jgi:hypothetical protein
LFVFLFPFFFAEANTRGLNTAFHPRDVLYTFGNTYPGALTLGNFPKFLTQLEIGGNRTIDLAAMDILRDRERGVPRYNAFRRLYKMSTRGSYADITKDPETISLLETVYGPGNVDDVDLLVGCLAETAGADATANVPLGFAFAETSFMLFVLMASRRIMADRFLTKDYTAAVYTQDGLDWIESASFKSILVRHHPELAPALAKVTNAFHPWQFPQAVKSRSVGEEEN